MSLAHRIESLRQRMQTRFEIGESIRETNDKDGRRHLVASWRLSRKRKAAIAKARLRGELK